MASFSPQQQAFIGTYAKLTGLNPGVVAAQVAAEEPVGASSGWYSTQNWLNIGITDSGPMGAGNPAWHDPVKAAQLSAQWVKGQTSIPGFGSASPGIRAITQTAGQSPQAQISALQKSGWASSGYPSLPSLYNTYRGTNPPAATGPPATAAGGPSFSTAGPTVQFDQQAFDKAQKAAIAGQYLADSANSGSMWQTGPKSSVPAGANLFGPGLLTTTKPNPADYTTTSPAHTAPVAHAALQDLAGGTALSTHPAVKAAADKILNMAVAAIGGPYSQAAHATAFTQSAAQLRKTGTDCSGFVSWLMGPDGLGIWKNALATPQIPSAPGIQKGPGQAITIYNNPLPGNSGHVFIQIGGRFFQSAGGGTGIQAISSSAAQGMIKNGDNGAPYYALHPQGY